jgi:hypothetical protein
MRILLLLLMPLAGCAPLSPEQRANVAYVLQQQAARDSAYAAQSAAWSQQTIGNAFHPQGDYPTYYARPDPITGGTMISPHRYGY